MNIYLITRTDTIDYDEYDAHIIKADSKDKAFKLAAMCDESNSKITLIGTTITSENEEEVILSSFNAG